MRIKKSIIWTLAVLVVICFIAIYAFVSLKSTVHSNLKGTLPQKLTAFMDQKAMNDGFNGVVLVAKDGKAVFQKGYGFADREAGTPNTLNTQFRIASLTKSFTAISILQLENEGKLKISDPLTKYIPGFRNGDKITIHDLLTHTSGVKDHFKLTDTTKPITLPQFINLMKNQSLDFSPGSQYKYSNTGYMILAYIVEKVSGESYGTYYQEHIFNPSGMTHTYLRAAQAKNLAVGYENMKSDIMKDDESQLAGFGDIISTAGDMLKYDNAIDDGLLIPPDKVKEMETGYIDSAKWGLFKYGYAWNVADNPISFGRPLIEHNGTLPGFKSDLADFVKDRVTVIILSNNYGSWPTGPLARELASIPLHKRFWFFQKDF